MSMRPTRCGTSSAAGFFSCPQLVPRKYVPPARQRKPVAVRMSFLTAGALLCVAGGIVSAEVKTPFVTSFPEFGEPGESAGNGRRFESRRILHTGRFSSRRDFSNDSAQRLATQNV